VRNRPEARYRFELMSCSVLCIGTELTRGELINSNAAWISAALTDLGFEVTEHAVVDDDRQRIVTALGRLSQNSQIVVCTGGLGPTTDDITSEAAASALGVELYCDDESLEHLRRRFEKLGREISESNKKQAYFPLGSTILPNAVGTAPGFEMTLGQARFFFMPGVPSEMKRMFDEQVAPRIRSLAANDSYQVRLRTFGLPESTVGDKLKGVESKYPGVTIGYRAHFPEIEVKVLARVPGEAALAQDVAIRAAYEVRSRLRDVVFGEGEDTFAGVVGRALRSRGWKLAIAESCTGGLLGHMMTREPGASDYFLFDAVTYANSAKQAVLGVDEDVLRGHGAVSAECAVRMAEGARRVSGADIALAITGIAGPTGGTEAKPVGLVYFAISTSQGSMVRERTFPGDRLRVQTLAAYVGLGWVREACGLSG